MVGTAEIAFYVAYAVALTAIGWVSSIGIALLAHIPMRLAGIREPILSRWTRRKWRWLATSAAVCATCMGLAFANEEQWVKVHPVQMGRVLLMSTLTWFVIWGGYMACVCISIVVAAIGALAQKRFPRLSHRLGLHEHPLLHEDDSA